MSNRNVLRQVKEDFDWKYYVESHYEVKYAQGKNGLELRVCCPHCGETGFKCYINPDRKAFYCFKCDFNVRNYDLFDFVSLTEGISRGVALLNTIQEYKPRAPTDAEVESFLQEPEESEASNVSNVRYLDGLPKEAVPLKAETGNVYWEYVQSRGFTKEDLRICNLHYVPIRCPVYNKAGKYTGNLQHRILFPIYHNRKLSGWIARSILDNGSGKYLNSPDTDISKTLWPFSKPYGSEVVLVEGIIDALAVRRVSGVSSYATFGKRISEDQIQVLKQWEVESVVLWYDKKDALSDMKRAVEQLKMHFKQVFVLRLEDWPADKDAGNCLSDTRGTAMIEEALTQRINVYDPLEYAKWTRTF